MRTFDRRSVILFVAGALCTAAVVYLFPARPVQATVAHGNDKFSMVTVPTAPGETETVFVLNHLTGVLRGAFVNNQSKTFTHHFMHNVAADFQSVVNSTEPKYAIVSSNAQLGSMVGMQPAQGVLFIGELTSGAVIAYTYPMPRGRGVPAPFEVVKLDFFKFAEAVGQ
jgi:hypothetical protein